MYGRLGHIASMATLCALVTAAAAADPIRVQGGQLLLGTNLGRTQLSMFAGLAEFQAAGEAASIDRGVVPSLLTVGQPLNLSHTFNQTFDQLSNPNRFPYALAIVDGTLYEHIILQAVNFSFVAPTGTVGDGVFGASMYSPFTFTGTLQGFTPTAFGTPGALLFSRDLTGQGVAALSVNQVVGGVSPYAVAYGFQPAGTPSPTPEPGTLLLVGSALIGLLTRRSERTTRR